MDMAVHQPEHRGPDIRRFGMFGLALVFGLVLPVVGTLTVESLFPGWSRAHLPFHSVVEVAGSMMGLVMGLLLLSSHGRRPAFRRVCMACALISMGVLDIAHSSISPGNGFVWLHSIAGLAGGAFFALAWWPDHTVPRRAVAAWAVTALGIALMIGAGTVLLPDWVPAMLTPEGAFTLVALEINVAGGVLTLLGGLAFARAYFQYGRNEDLVFVFLCFLFGSSGLLFYTSDIWQAGWWFWHAIRLVAYLIPFGLVLMTYSSEEDRHVRTQTRLARAIAQGDYSLEVHPRDAGDDLGAALHDMTAALRSHRTTFEEMDWLKDGLSRMDNALRGDPTAEALATRVITELATRIEAPVGAFYIADEEGGTFSLVGSYAFTARKNLSDRFRIGEGLVGQAARERQPILLRNVPEDYLRITTQLGECTPRFVLVTPFLHEEQVKGVFELGTLREPTALQHEYIQKAGEALGLAVEGAQSRSRLARSLQESRELTEELQTQEEELRVSNEELEEQANTLKRSEERLKTQQEELQVTNAELEEKRQSLEIQKRELTRASRELKKQAGELERSNQYKSEFLANMSHELRTPLNSLLILAGSLAENRQGNLTDDQVESAKVMLDSGESLLSLINEILDLSKIEAGHMDLEFEPVPLTSLVEDTRRMFDPVFEQKGLDFDIRLADSCPEEIISDRKRISQVLKNLISNASKFTEEGGVTVTFEAGECRGGPGMVFAVEDTGCGIPEKKQHLIFEAFRQAEGGTARKYGGTGLGLSISRELVRILGGEIGLESEEGRGSVFRVSLPLQPADEQVAGTAQRGDEKGSFSTQVAGRDPVPDGEGVLPAFGSVPDDREELEEEARPILIIEDDSSFASVLVEQCHDKGLKALVASSGEEGIQLAKTRNPGAVILDLRLPGMNGWTVLNQLKESVETRHIPVHIMSAEDPPQKALTSGAIGFLRKPVQKEKLDEAFERIEDMYERGMKDLLVVEDDDTLRKAVLELIGNGDVHGEGVGTGKQALEILQNKRYDCLILDLNLPDMSGFDLLEAAGRDETITLPPVIVYTGRELTREEEGRLNAYSESIIVKGVRSRERLFDEASLFLHRMVKKMPEFQREMIVSLHESERMFEGKRVLIVDDDMRNLFALSSSLSAKGMRTLKAADGIKALDMLEQHPDVDLVLMDIMMPEMDGYEAMRTLRSDSRFEGLPVIALTAKAMQDDRRKCLEAGANDYLSKPIDLDRLFSMMRVWLYR